MNTPNPLVPQGSLQQHARGKANVRIAVFTILAIHVVLLGGLLMQGCKDKNTGGSASGATNSVADSIPPLNTTNDIASFATPSAPAPNTALPTNPPLVTATPSANTSAPVVEAPVSPTPAATGSTREYLVARGDTLTTIAKKTGTSRKQIEAANPGLVPTKLKAGQKINIPATASNGHSTATKSVASTGSGEGKGYVVRPGDTLTKIAKANGTSAGEIKRMNELKTDRINVGQRLKLPARATAEATTPTGGNAAGAAPANLSGIR